MPGSAEKVEVEPGRALADLIGADLAGLGVTMAGFAAAVAAMGEAFTAALAPLGEAMCRALTMPGWHSEPGPRGPLGDPCGDPPRSGIDLAGGLEPPSVPRQAAPVDRRRMETVWRPREDRLKAAPYLSVSRPAGFGAARG